MFGLLKKKFNDFTEKIFGKSKEKIDSLEDSPKDSISQETTSPFQEDVLVEEKAPFQEEVLVEKEPLIIEKKVIVKEEVLKKEEEFVDKKPLILEKEKTTLEKEKTILEKKEIVLENDLNLGQEKTPSPSIKETEKDSQIKKDFSSEYKELESKKIEDVKKSTFTKIKSLFSSKVKLSESEISAFLEDFEISLLEADVSLESSSSIISDLKVRLLENSFSKSDLLDDIKQKIKETLKEQLNIDCNIDNYIKKEKEEPLIVLIIGPNGAGKTTTISKLASLYKNQGKTVVLSSSDTFRAGSIDQLEVHAKRLGVRVIKQTYGSDPAAVAFDAVSSAKANKNDVVLIDTAGRQDTNVNLMQELSKIKRVVKPHLTIYIGESQSGQAIVEQIEKFDKEIGITGVVLTKIDTDPKGGVAISILNELKKPIFYIGTGQEYKDLEKFSPEYIIERII